MAGDDVNFWKRTDEQRFEPCVAIQGAAVAGANHIWNQACEQDFVADALLTPDQKAAGGQRFACPERLRVGSPWRVVILTLPAPLIVAPARGEVALK